MPSTPTPGPSTLGGAGWQPRATTHAEEIGSVWTSCCVRSQVSPLRAVMLASPGEEQRYPEAPNDWLMYERPDLPRLRAQADALAAAYGRAGVTVHWSAPSRPKPNHLFMCDLFWMTPEGAVLARMASRQRAGEERGAAEALAKAGVPILLTPRGTATFEGADAMWLDARTALIGVDKRTNREAVEQMAPVLRGMGVQVRVASIGGAVQHLLGVVNMVDADTVFALASHLTPSLREALAGLRLVELPSDEETEGRRAMNFVTLGPRRILMPTGCPRTRELYERHGVACEEVDVSEYIKAAGAVGCITGIVARA